MGIKNFIKLIQKYAPTAIKNTTIINYKNKTIAIDANLLIHKLILAVRLNGYDIKNSNIIVTHIHTLLQQIKAFIKYKITPIFVFDGPHPKHKQHILDARHKTHTILKQKYESATTPAEKKKWFYAKAEISPQEYNDCIALIKLFNYTIIQAPEEADAQIAYLTKNGYASYAVSDDLDLLVFGTPIPLKNFSTSTKKSIQEINLQTIKKTTSITQNQLIDIAILLGCDYCESPPKIGPVSSYIKIKQHNSLTKLIKHKQIPPIINYKSAQSYFKNPPITTNIKINELNINKNGLVTFLKQFNFSDKYIKNLPFWN